MSPVLFHERWYMLSSSVTRKLLSMAPHPFSCVAMYAMTGPVWRMRGSRYTIWFAHYVPRSCNAAE